MKRKPLDEKLKDRVYLIELELLRKPKHCPLSFEDPIYVDSAGVYVPEMDSDIAYLLKSQGKTVEEEKHVDTMSKTQKSIAQLKKMFGMDAIRQFKQGVTKFGS